MTTEKQAVPKIYNLDELDTVSPCETPVEIELTDTRGNPIGVYVSVLGEFSTQVGNGLNKLINQSRLQDTLNAKANAEQKYKPIEEDIEFGRKSVAIRVAAWRNIAEPCTLDNVVKLLTKNPHFAEQINSTSKDLGKYLSKQ